MRAREECVYGKERAKKAGCPRVVSNLDSELEFFSPSAAKECVQELRKNAARIESRQGDGANERAGENFICFN